MLANKDPKGRKWQLTINNPYDKGFTHEKIKCELRKLKSLLYWCMADEKGNEEETPHTHIYTVFSSAVRFTTLKNLFPSAHLERVNGTSQVNKEYVAKTGKWANTDKAKTVIEGSFYEEGTMPLELRNSGGIESIIMERILDGANNAQILLEFPEYLRGIRDVEYVRQSLKAEEYRNKWRDLETVYIWGATGTGKTRSVMDKYGYSNVYSVNNYKHPFDGYAGEDVILFDEFNSDIRIQDMNNYLDGYPISLPARYSNKQACYERAYLISNLDLTYQYRNEQNNKMEVYRAFLRRVHKVIHFNHDGSKKEYSTKEYMSTKSNNGGWAGAGGWDAQPLDIQTLI